MNTLRLGTRGSQLALWQARTAAALVEGAGGPPCEIVIIKTSGDKLAEAPLSEVGGKRLFVKEIEDALLRDEIDFAVHSCKDMPAVLPDGLAIGAVLPREDPRDVLVLPEAPEDGRQGSRPHEDDPEDAAQAGRRQDGEEPTLESLLARLGQRPRVATSSVRRVAELKRLMPNASFLPIRGNLDTRLRKLDRGDADLLVLAAAGIRRLGFASRISFTLPVEACVPAPAQGAIAIELRADDQLVRQALARIDDRATGLAVEAERALVAALGGGCQTPIGAVALAEGDALDLHAVVVSLDGQQAVRARDRAPMAEAALLGARVARVLLEQGAGLILDDVRRAQAPTDGIQP